MAVNLRIYRYNPDKNQKPYYQSFSIPYKRGMKVLDGLIYIQKNLDKTLAFRWECRSKICGTCGVTLNKTPVLSCGAEIDPNINENLIEPLDNFPVERDLIVDIRHVLERLKRVRPYLEKLKDIRITEAEANKSKPFRKCIECGCCIAGSKTVNKNQYGILDPMALVKIARFATDPRDSLNRKLVAQQEGVKVYNTEEAKKLTNICPRGVPIDKAVRLLKK